MILAIDIGNTAVSFALLKKQTIIKRFFIETNLSVNVFQREFRLILTKLGKNYPQLKRVMVCSVVPSATKLVEKNVRSVLNINSTVIGRDVVVPLKNNYRNPKQVGQDRLVCAYAARVLYGAPAIIIDLGTAITFDIVSKQGSYEGGIIVPGIRLSAESLFQKTALLPRIENIKSPRNLVGKNTVESILSGLFFGYGSMVCGLVDRLEQQLKGKPKVIVTGGYTHLMKRFILKKIDTIDDDLIFKGMVLLDC